MAACQHSLLLPEGTARDTQSGKGLAAGTCPNVDFKGSWMGKCISGDIKKNLFCPFGSIFREGVRTFF